MKKIGLFFGSFNPIHIGHLAVAQYMWQEIPFDEVWLMISPHNPHKEIEEVLSVKRRLKMAKLAIGKHPAIKASDIEFNLSLPSYTINTLKFLENTYKKHKFSLIMGEDNLVKFNCWKAYDEILNNYKIFIYPRKMKEGAEIPANILKHKNIHFTRAPLIEISATMIRTGIQEKKDHRFYLTKNVYTYIRENKLYQ